MVNPLERRPTTSLVRQSAIELVPAGEVQGQAVGVSVGENLDRQRGIPAVPGRRAAPRNDGPGRASGGTAAGSVRRRIAPFARLGVRRSPASPVGPAPVPGSPGSGRMGCATPPPASSGRAERNHRVVIRSLMTTSALGFLVQAITVGFRKPARHCCCTIDHLSTEAARLGIDN